MTDQDRAEFEAFAIGKYGLIQQDMLRGQDGYYCKMTRLAYAAWTTSRRTQSEQVRELLDMIEEIDNLPRNHRDIVDLEILDDHISKVVALATEIRQQDDE